MKEQSKISQVENQQGGSKSNQMHDNQSAREQTKKQGISNSGGQGSYETSNKRTGGYQGNKK